MMGARTLEASVPTFYVDETGFTGEDLLEANQPIFVEATHDFSKTEVAEIIDRIFAGVKATELKYRSLSRRPAYQELIVELIRFAAAKPNRVATWIAHKEYALVTMVVEWWVEPLAHATGLNLYKNGGNHALANMLFICLEGFWDAKFRKKILLSFQRMFRARTKERFEECRELIEKEKDAVSGDAKRSNVIGFLWLPFEGLGFEHLATLPQHALDLALPGLVRLALNWRGTHEGPWHVVHDRSSNMARQKWLWDALSSPDIEQAKFEGAHGAAIFPLNITATTFADSATEKEIQICDIIAGATSASMRLPAEDAYRKKLHEAGIIDFVVDPIWPSTDVTPKELGKEGLDGNNLIEWLATQMATKGVVAPS